MRAIRLLTTILAISAFGTGCGGSDSGGGSASGGSPATGGSGGGAGTVSSGGSSGAGTGGGGVGGSTATCPEGYELGEVSGKPVVEVKFGSSGPYKFVYDTGAPDSAMDSKVYQEVGAGPHTLEIGGRQVDIEYMYTVAVEQMGIPGIDGIIGADVMRNFAVTLDVQRKRFWLDVERDEDALIACSHTDGKPAEIVYREADYLYVPGKAEGVDGWFLVDSGASLGGMRDSIFDQLQTAHARPALEGFYTPAAIGTFWARFTAVGELEVGGLAVQHILTRTFRDDLVPFPNDLDAPFLGLLPTDYLRHFLLTVDYKSGKLRLDGYRDLDSREPSKYFSVGIGLEETTELPIHVAQVLPGSSAEEKGVKVGDEVVSIAGLSIGSLTPYQRPWAFMDSQPNTPVAVELKRGTETLSVKLETRDLLSDPAL